MKIVTVAVTAIVVSLDSFMAGFSLSLNKRATTVLPSAVALITLLMCMATSAIGKALSAFAEQYVNVLGAVLLLALAMLALFRTEEAHASLTAVSIGESVTIGVAVGMDAAIANLGFAGQGLEWVTPIVFAVTHYITVALGQVLAKKVRLRHANVFSAVILAVVAITKLL